MFPYLPVGFGTVHNWFVFAGTLNISFYVFVMGILSRVVIVLLILIVKDELLNI